MEGDLYKYPTKNILKIYLLYAQMSIYCVSYAFTVIYLLLDARNL
jgi:hypothetical protein